MARHRRNTNIPKPYKSGLEYRISKRLGNDVEYEAERLPFVQPAAKRTYLPDFKIKENVYIETKGRFTSADRKKHLWIKQQLPHITVYFIFQNPKNKISKRSKTTYADWCTENGFKFIGENQRIPKDWFK